jgi:hypothetical protein
VWRGYEVASSITLADEPAFAVLAKNLTRDKEACIEAGMILGHFEVLNTDVEVKALRVSNTPANAVDSSIHGKGNDAVDTTQSQPNQPNSQMSQSAPSNEISELNELEPMDMDERDEALKASKTNFDTPQLDSPREGEGVPRSTASPTSPRQDPAVSILVTQDRRVHTPDEAERNSHQGVALRGGLLVDVAWQEGDMQPEAWSSRDVRGTREECQSRGKIIKTRKSPKWRQTSPKWRKFQNMW